MRSLSMLALAAIAVTVLAGCTGSPADAGEPSTPVVTAEPSPAPTPTPAPVEADPADPSTWLIDADGIGPFELGMPLDAAVALVPDYTVETCPNPAVRFLGSETASSPTIILVAADDGGLAEVTLSGSTQPATAGGIRVGSTVTEATSAYPGLELTQRYADRYTLEGTPGWISFTTEGLDVGPTAPITTISVVEGAVPPSEYCG
ncbi:hypothetical protein [Agromyces cerinus]|uniref:Lipoprotein LpqN n=1 Tax=Agromyces cerinus subsp. cerinus TaxID=232089 RepID=A0A1N6GPB9_9MICO|nr:hypothetical protein [Agromyces cerinus]SIO09409.1 hypothetical protein SAMN05443544_2754 [Agromyces cerinus subsp. cerinus]